MVPWRPDAHGAGAVAPRTRRLRDGAERRIVDLLAAGAGDPRIRRLRGRGVHDGGRAAYLPGRWRCSGRRPHRPVLTTTLPRPLPDLTAIAWPEATERLLADPAFGPLVQRVGPVRLRAGGETPFAALTRSIIHQQLAGAAASTIHVRFRAALGGAVTPAAALALGTDPLRAAGLSSAKAASIIDLARRVAEGELDLDALGRLPDAEVIARLTTIRGIGPWTARMFLMFDLCRPDVWPTGDLGVRNGLGRVLGLRAMPTPKEAEWIGTGYRPWRSAVAWYCWRAVEVPPPA